ncbi:DNA repair protein RadA [Thioalkalivibrio sp. XN279]|uniref:DNA repair protein RadA n=1 Tax=Thioalkalivibrio sp. XN279 TaxID=2714953 RepID=UPI0014094BAB|nr:DNA repair protein RadA [Thioalkalivibrio sp. XN279]NHA14751.1 DNA repair protein RadA [Thioalkalivibrio sp. XN279]
MAKPKTLFVCSECGGSSPKWVGQCPDCGRWNTLEESLDTARPRAVGWAGEAPRLVSEVEAESESRWPTGIGELDRVLGGGLVPGSVTLIGGDPGIGKSTLLLQAAVRLAGAMPTLYVTGEESLRQVGMRARRIGMEEGALKLLAETNIERILAQADTVRPRVLVVDSIQTMHTDALQSAPGAVAQLRESSARLVRYAKQGGPAVFLVGHVTKDGAIAGPRVLEHMVDAVLYFESDVGSRFRIIRAVKNRFGAANEIGVFAMTGQGLREVLNPSSIFLSGHDAAVSGSAVMVAREGSRPLLVEVQALVDESHGGHPRRVSVGLDSNRLALLLAVMHRHAGIAMYDQDVFVNVVGGVRIVETAADLPMLLAALGSLRDRPLERGLVSFGEVGLAGEIRPVPYGEERLREAAKHGFRRAVVPAANAPRARLEGLEVVPVKRLGEAIEAAFG